MPGVLAFSNLCLLRFLGHASEELQAALASAAQNSSEDQILVEPGLYVGSFRYKGTGPEQLLIEGISDSSGELPILDGGKLAYVFWFESASFESDLTIKISVVTVAKLGGGLGRWIF